MLVLALGFDHVSDDDYARVTIAQAFAHAPRLDPSGTSWLPFPFWGLGGAMMVIGRSLAAARVASIAFASVAAALPYLALRTTGATRTTSMLAVGFAVLSPWGLWLGAATVPESFTASFTTAAAIALGCGPSRADEEAALPGDAWVRLGRSPWMRLVFALALVAACLSRYEAWPVAAVLAIALAVRGSKVVRRVRVAEAGESDVRRARFDGQVELVLAILVALGPLAWMSWNAHAHGDALHFFQRVARFKRALGDGSPGTLEALLLYPRLFVLRRPDVTLAMACALVGARFFMVSHAELRRRWLVPVGCAAAQLLFLAYGNARDGAPAHHAERALLGVQLLTATAAVIVLAEAAPAAWARARRPALALATAVAAAWLVNGMLTLRDVPGSGSADERSSQIAEGKALRDERVADVEITPCAYEHFAVIAAFGAPEHVTIHPSTNAPVTASCPVVVRR